MRIHGRQLAAARVLLGISQAELASATSLSVPTIRRMEASESQVSGLANNIKAVQDYLEKQGIKFLFEDGGQIGVMLQTEPEQPVVAWAI